MVLKNQWVSTFRSNHDCISYTFMAKRSVSRENRTQYLWLCTQRSSSLLVCLFEGYIRNLTVPAALCRTDGRNFYSLGQNNICGFCCPTDPFGSKMPDHGPFQSGPHSRVRDLLATFRVHFFTYCNKTRRLRNYAVHSQATSEGHMLWTRTLLQTVSGKVTFVLTLPIKTTLYWKFKA